MTDATKSFRFTVEGYPDIEFSVDSDPAPDIQHVVIRLPLPMCEAIDALRALKLPELVVEHLPKTSINAELHLTAEQFELRTAAGDVIDGRIWENTQHFTQGLHRWEVWGMNISVTPRGIHLRGVVRGAGYLSLTSSGDWEPL